MNPRSMSRSATTMGAVVALSVAAVVGPAIAQAQTASASVWRGAQHGPEADLAEHDSGGKAPDRLRSRGR